MSQAGSCNTGGGPFPPVGPLVYAQVYNVGAEICLPGNYFTYDSNGLLANVTHVLGSSVITINADGLYAIHFEFNATTQTNIQVHRNGVAIPAGDYQFNASGSAPDYGHVLVVCSAGDTIQLFNNGPLDITVIADGNINASVIITKVTTTGSSGTGVLTINTNSGSANEVAGVMNLLTSNATFLFSAAGNTITLDFFQPNSNIGSNLPAITVGTRNTGYGAGVNQSLTSGNDNTTVGYGAFVNATTASQNIAIGSQALNANVVADDNVAVGFQALTLSTGGFENVAIGTRSMANLTSGDSNTAVGYLSLFSNLTGSNSVAIGSGSLLNALNDRNIALGYQAGVNATTNSSCIYIGHGGVAAESNTMRLGTDGGGVGQVDTTVIAGDVESVRSFTALTGNITANAGDMVLVAGNLDLPIVNVAGTQGLITYTGAGLANRFIHGFGTQNFFAGYQAGNTSLTVATAIGNTGVGYTAMNALTIGGGNTSLGQNSAGALSSGDRNTAIGLDALELLSTGSDNIALGEGAGSVLTTESSNIDIGNTGVVADSGTIRIGTNATHTSAFIAGIDGVNLASANVVTEVADQLGTATITAGSGISISTATPNQIIISSTGADLLAYTNVNTSPYVVAAGDEYLGVDVSVAPITLQFPNAPAQGRVYIVKDFGGNAGTFNITLTSVGGAIGFDGALSYVMNTNLQSVQLLFDGTNYQIF